MRALSARVLLSTVLAVGCLLIASPDVHAQCTSGLCGGAVQASTCGSCGGRGPVRKCFRWLRARRQANVARLRGGRLPRLFPLLWQ